MCCKCGAARIIQAEAASVDLCPKYAHASGGQECRAPELIVRISGGLCIVYTAQRSGNSSLVLSDCCFFSQSCGSREETEDDWEEEPVHKHSSPPVELTNSDRQLTHSSKQRPTSGLWLCGRRQPEGCCNWVFIQMSVAKRPNSTSSYMDTLLLCVTFCTRFACVVGLSGDLHQQAEKAVTNSNNTIFGSFLAE